ncbi:MAG: NADH-quinone oxidoreductase subunit D [Actinobacteria bacterium]|nr:NADH-quinone oxidoreductase subunit D [Actinomycetota bacterium]
MVDFPRVGMVGGTETIVLNMGPQHPSTHGVMHLLAEINGEQVVAVKPIIGYLHRGIEKLCEHRTYPQVQVLVDRLDYVAGFSNELAYCRAVEKLCGFEVPERAEYIRVLFTELVRITSHLIWLGAFANDLGAWTPVLYAFVDREVFNNFYEENTGSRMMPNYFRFGGVKEDLIDGSLERLHAYIAEKLFKNIDDLDTLVGGNEIFQSRTKGISPITTEQAIEWGITGPMLRATGVPRDLRKDDPYSIYSELDFKVPTATEGDVFARYVVRMEEMRESARMILRVIERMPEGEVRAKVPKAIKPPEGEVYVRTESPKGELGVYIVSDGSTKPYKIHFRSPIFQNLSALPQMACGWKIADLISISGSVDVVMGEIDR